MCHETYTISWGLLLYEQWPLLLISILVALPGLIGCLCEFIKLLRKPGRGRLHWMKKAGGGLFLLLVMIFCSFMFLVGFGIFYSVVTYRLDSDTIAEVQINVYWSEQPKYGGYELLGTVAVTDKQAICELIRLLHQYNWADIVDRQPSGWSGRQYYMLHFKKAEEVGRHGEKIRVIVEDDDGKQIKLLQLGNEFSHHLVVVHNPAVCDWVVDQTRDQFPPPW